MQKGEENIIFQMENFIWYRILGIHQLLTYFQRALNAHVTVLETTKSYQPNEQLSARNTPVVRNIAHKKARVRTQSVIQCRAATCE
jgi:hypothetical protein